MATNATTDQPFFLKNGDDENFSREIKKCIDKHGGLPITDINGLELWLIPISFNKEDVGSYVSDRAFNLSRLSYHIQETKELSIFISKKLEKIGPPNAPLGPKPDFEREVLTSEKHKYKSLINVRHHIPLPIRYYYGILIYLGFHRKTLDRIWRIFRREKKARPPRFLPQRVHGRLRPTVLFLCGLHVD